MVAGTPTTFSFARLRLTRALVPAFAAAIFTSATLLFVVQPMFTKFALPLLGGAPNVWNTAMVFFQAVLLLGYAYAHILSTRVPLRGQVAAHALVLAAGFAFLPLAAPDGWTPPAAGGQGLWLLGFMGVAIGAPFFALSATAPLLQRWFSRTSHPTADDPYYLYAASNVGSLLSLLAYPTLIEPNLGLAAQSTIWSAGYLTLFALIAAAGVIAVTSVREKPIAEAVEEPTAFVSWRDRAGWFALAVAPSGLMLSATTHLTTNVAPAPFLWIIPLSLYLLSFVVVFSRAGERVQPLFEAAAPVGVVLAIATAPFLKNAFIATSAIHVGMFFLVALALHGRLAARRPASSRLTEFYLCMSFGGVVGGIVTALIAPVLLPGVWEYPALLALATFLVLWRMDATAVPFGSLTRGTVAMIAALFVAAFVGGFASRFGPADSLSRGVILVLLFNVIGLLGLAYLARRHAALLAGVVLVLWPSAQNAADYAIGLNWKRLHQDRSFFGVLAVDRHVSEAGPLNVLIHGSIIHNLQLRGDGNREVIPLAYFSSMSPYAQAFKAMRALRPNLHVGNVGLGAGALACHAQPTDQLRFYEIDPNVVRVATDPSLFSFIDRCAPDARIYTGDGRLLLQAEAASRAQKFDLLVIDAFSSDSIPAHLITREAIELYRQRIKDDGVILFHTSNRYMDVSSVAIRSAEAAGLDWLYTDFTPPDDAEPKGFVFGMDAVVIGDAAAVAAFAARLDRTRRNEWSRASAHPLVAKAWTDDYSNVLGALRAKAVAKKAE